jgi:hypothetical protein
LIHASGTLEALPEIMTRLARGELPALCHRIDY